MRQSIGLLRATCASLGLMAALAAAPASAQSSQPEQPVQTEADGTTAETPQDIVVTGSRIRRNPLDLDAPVTFVDERDIARTGLNSASEVLQRLPSSGGGLSSKFNNSGNLGNPPDGGGVGAGAAEIDLRYLGSRRVLVLVDGLRFVNGASGSGIPGSTDLNSIPESAISRIEVLQDGASAIYGSDAIAGVVNIITKSSQRGFQASAQVGGYAEEGDGMTQNYQLSWGNGSGGPLRIVVGGNYVKQDPVWSGDRALSAWPEPYDTACRATCSGFTPNGRYGGSIFPFADATLIAPVIGRTTTPADFRAFTSPGDRWNFQPFNYLQVPVERAGVFANLRYEVSPAINLSVRTLFNRRESKNQAAPQPFGFGPTSGISPVLSELVISASNPFNPFGVDLGGANGNVTSVLRRFLEGGPRRFSQKVDTAYGVASLDGRLGGDWFWDVNVSYGRNKADQVMIGNIDTSKLRQAVGPIAQCTAPCVPFNFFGGFGSITQPMLNFIMFEQNDSSKQTQFDTSANLSGNLMQLPGGPLGLAVGVEYRRLRGSFTPDPVVSAGFSADIPAQPTRGGYNVREAFAELNAPVLGNLPGVELLELNGAVRLSDYSTSGSTTTFKAGVNWKPIRDLRLRASWAEGFRAPQIGELFGTQSRFDEVLNDPCSSHSSNTSARRFANDAVVRAACIAAGVPADGSYQQANAQISVNTGGNRNLKPEVSRSMVYGLVYSPAFARGLAIEANWYRIKVEGAIQAIPRATTLLNCLLTGAPAVCGLVTRVNGQLTEVQGLLQNIAAIKTRGVDLNISHRGIETRAGRFGLTWNTTFLQKYDVFVPAPSGTQLLERAGTQVGSPAQAFPKRKSIAAVDWDLGQVGASLTGRYISKLIEPTNVMDSVFYTDLQLRWNGPSFARGLGFAVGVNNLFDVATPGCVSCESNNFSQAVHDIPGRYYYARASFKM